MIGPTVAPAQLRQPQSWGLRIGVLMFVGLVVLVVLGPLVWDIDPTHESFESLPTTKPLRRPMRMPTASPDRSMGADSKMAVLMA